MREINVPDEAYEEASRRAGAAGFKSVDAYVTSLLQVDAEDFDARFTPEVGACLSRVTDSMLKGHRISEMQLTADLDRVRKAWLESRAS